MDKKYNTLHIMCRNGWRWLHYNGEKNESGDEYSQFQATILGRSYSSKITAVVSDLPEHLQLDGHYGVLWLDAEYENKPPFSYEDLFDMQAAIIHAEENLLAVGMPFTADYIFHGSNAANMRKRNEKLRRMYNLEEQEKKDVEKS